MGINETLLLDTAGQRDGLQRLQHNGQRQPQGDPRCPLTMQHNMTDFCCSHPSNIYTQSHTHTRQNLLNLCPALTLDPLIMSGFLHLDTLSLQAHHGKNKLDKKRIVQDSTLDGTLLKGRME